MIFNQKEDVEEDVEEDVKVDDDEPTEEEQLRFQEAEYQHMVKGHSKKEAERRARISHPDGFTKDEIEVIRKKLSGFDGIDKRIQALEVKYKQAQSYGVSPGEALADIHTQVMKPQKKKMELFRERLVRQETIQSEIYRRNIMMVERAREPQARLAYKPGTHVAPHLPENLGDLVAGFMDSVPEPLWVRSDSDSSGVSHVSATQPGSDSESDLSLHWSLDDDDEPPNMHMPRNIAQTEPSSKTFSYTDPSLPGKPRASLATVLAQFNNKFK
jgi:hypothetical protein